MSAPGEIDPVIHAVARLRITAVLAALDPGDSLSFARLGRELDLTSGNLITHLRKLEEAGYVVSEKSGSGRSATTQLTLTADGRSAFATYTETLRAIIAASDEPVRTDPG